LAFLHDRLDEAADTLLGHDITRLWTADVRMVKSGMCIYILAFARGKVVKDNYLVAYTEIRVSNVRSDESCPAGDEDSFSLMY
jgi:hypothetical protein